MLASANTDDTSRGKKANRKCFSDFLRNEKNICSLKRPCMEAVTHFEKSADAKATFHTSGAKVGQTFVYFSIRVPLTFPPPHHHHYHHHPHSVFPCQRFAVMGFGVWMWS